MTETYSIESDGVPGRLHWSNLGTYRVSTVDNRVRENFSDMAAIRNMMFAITTRYETAVLTGRPRETVVVWRGDDPQEAETAHRRIVEEVLAGRVFTKDDDCTRVERDWIGTNPDKMVEAAEYRRKVMTEIP